MAQSLPMGLLFEPSAALLHQLAEVAVYGRDTRVGHFEQPRFACGRRQTAVARAFWSRFTETIPAQKTSFVGLLDHWDDPLPTAPNGDCTMKNSLRLTLGLAVIVTWLCISGTPVALSQDLGWGSTHATWEKQAIRSTIYFKDSVATAVRAPNGSAEATLTSSDGEVLAKLDFGAGRASSLRLTIRQKGEQGWSKSTEISYTALESPVLDWLNLHLYSWSKDVPGRGEDILLSDQSKLRVDAALNEVVAAELDFGSEYSRSIPIGSGFIAHLWERTSRDVRLKPWKVIEEDRARDDKLLAVLVWQEDQQALSFSIGPSQLEKRYFKRLRAEDIPSGYFSFQPTMVWANVQIRQLWSAQSFAAVLGEKNSPGCDGLHWVDGTSLRDCCDAHDRCYEAHRDYTGAPCTAASWFWPFCGTTPSCTWRCQICNVQVVLCFFIPNIQPFYPPQDPGSECDGGFDCYLSFPGDYCPAYCRACCS